MDISTNYVNHFVDCLVIDNLLLAKHGQQNILVFGSGSDQLLLPYQL
jgi:hypothetical protein